jgi:CRISPR-associated protein Cmr6
MNNLHKLYYKDYYQNVRFSLDKNGDVNIGGHVIDIVGKGKSIQNGDLQPDLLAEMNGIVHKIFKVQYPGLVTGVGILHNAGVKGEFMLGMHFDYTYGHPIIYGSSVKGVLKSYFKECYEGGHNVDELIEDIFEGKKYGTSSYKSIYERDVFFDAIVCGANPHGKIIDSDALAPHGGPKHDNPFADPVPIAFLKIASGVKLKFRFRLSDTKDKDGKVIMPKQAKEKLFVNILETFGIGAKTNVGYGQLKFVPDNKIEEHK